MAFTCTDLNHRIQHYNSIKIHGTIFYNIDMGGLPMSIRRCSGRFRCCQFSMSDVYICRTLITVDKTGDSKFCNVNVRRALWTQVPCLTHQDRKAVDRCRSFWDRTKSFRVTSIHFTCARAHTSLIIILDWVSRLPYQYPCPEGDWCLVGFSSCTGPGREHL